MYLCLLYDMLIRSKYCYKRRQGVTMQSKKIIYAVIEDSEYEVIDQPVGEFELQVRPLDTISDLFSAISDSMTEIDIIGIDINRLINRNRRTYS